jgi:pilus assembly protein CpaC
MIRSTCGLALNPMRRISEITMNSTSLSKLRNRGGLMKISSCAAALLASFLVIAPSATNMAKATDMSVASVAGANELDFYRLGLDKSTIIHLPADAKDVIVGNAEIVDVVVRTKNTAYIFGRKVGQTNVFFIDANGQQIKAMNLEVALDPIVIRNLIKRSLPGTRITVDTSANNIILGGTAMNAAEAKTAYDLAAQVNGSGSAGKDAVNLVNTIKIAGEDQVMLQVKVVEIQRNVLKQFGIDFRALLNLGNFAFSLASNNPFANGLLSPDNGYKASFASGTSNFDSMIRAMETDGLIRTLAEPNLTTISGQSAKFLAGGEFPYSSCSGSGVAITCGDGYKEYGVSLNFTPTVLTDGRINLKIHTDVSDISTVAVSKSNAPSLSKRSVDTVLELPNGGAMMMAGLISESTKQNAAGTPGLKKLPILGALFRSRDFISNQTELVVIVTPHIVRSVAQQQLATPADNFAPTNDKQAIFMGHMNKIYGSAGKAPVGNYQGNVGFIVE